MNDNRVFCTRRCYLRTLHRHVGPLLAYRVTNAANSNTRAIPSHSLTRGQPVGAGANPSAPIFALDQFNHTPAHSEARQ